MSKTRTAMALLAAAVSATTARATLSFNFIGLSSLPTNVQAGFLQGASYWSNSLDDIQNGTAVNVTVNIAVQYVPLGAGILGQTVPSYDNVNSQPTMFYSAPSYSSVKAGLIAAATSADDATAVANLPSGSSFSAYINHTKNNSNSATPYIETGVNAVQITTANAKAIGLVPGNNTATDATIQLSSTFSWDFNPADGTDSGSLDFVGVVTHEIGHALGFGSAVDNIDEGSTSTATALAQNNPNYDPDVLDLFRYSTLSTGSSIIDLSADARNKYFSLNKGTTNIANFSQGVVNGDGNQASHWQFENTPLGIMTPRYAYGQTIYLSQLDRQAYDVLGWSRINTWKWTDTTSSSTAYWGNASQWSADGIPDTTIAVVFNNGSSTPYTIAVNTPSTAGSVTVATDDVTISLTNSTLTTGTVNLGQTSGNLSTMNVQLVTAGQFIAGNVNVGAVAGTTGHLNIQNGGILSSTGALAVAPVATSVGTVTVAAGTLSTTGDLTVGGTSSTSGGVGSLAVNTNGTVNVGGNFKLWGTTGTNASIGGGVMSVTGATTVSSGALLSVTAGRFTTNGMTLNGGFTQSGGTAVPGTITGSGSATVSAGTLTANQITLGALSLSGSGRVLMNSNGSNTGTSRMSSLSITSSGQYDLYDNDLILDYTTTSPITTIRGDLLSGFNAGNWNGPGLASTAANLNAQQNTALGYAEASQLGVTTFDNQSVDATTLLIKYTYYGDDNLDGKVDVNDFKDFLAGFASGGSTWFQGDYTYDGHVDLGNDFDLFLTSYISQGNALGTLEDAIVEAPQLSVAQRASLLSIVPEPSVLGMGLMVGCALIMRRRRTQRQEFCN